MRVVELIGACRVFGRCARALRSSVRGLALRSSPPSIFIPDTRHPPPAMTSPTPKVVLLDIEGTVCSISFVRDVLFPYALDVLPGFLHENWSAPEFAPYRDAFPAEACDTPEHLEAYVRELTAQDLKVPCLKQLQGLLWRTGYESGAIKAPIYADVPPGRFPPSRQSWSSLRAPASCRR